MVSRSRVQDISSKLVRWIEAVSCSFTEPCKRKFVILWCNFPFEVNDSKIVLHLDESFFSCSFEVQELQPWVFLNEYSLVVEHTQVEEAVGVVFGSALDKELNAQLDILLNDNALDGHYTQEKEG
jgi:hypothetical protein